MMLYGRVGSWRAEWERLPAVGSKDNEKRRMGMPGRIDKYIAGTVPDCIIL
jgi:hypothetical protein